MLSCSFSKKEDNYISKELCEICWLIFAKCLVIKGIVKMTITVTDTSTVKGSNWKIGTCKILGWLQAFSLLENGCFQKMYI